MEIRKDENVKRKPRTKKARIFNNGREFKALKLKTLGPKQLPFPASYNTVTVHLSASILT